MPVVARHHVLTLDDYFSTERMSESKYEFADGQIYVMAGGSLRHDRLETQTLQVLGRRLGAGPCFPMTTNRRIATGDGLYTYADGSVFCGDVELGPEQTALNPVLLIEVLSDRTSDYDRGEKLERYKTIPSLRHVLLIEQLRVDVEHWFRADDGWARRVHTSLEDVLRLDGLDVELPVAEIYDGYERFPT